MEHPRRHYRTERNRLMTFVTLILLVILATYVVPWFTLTIYDNL